MTEKDFDSILETLDRRAYQKKEINLAKAKAEMGAIDREYTAYYDGVYDAIKAVKNALLKEAANNATVN
jgi:hypothetical protein